MISNADPFAGLLLECDNEARINNLLYCSNDFGLSTSNLTHFTQLIDENDRGKALLFIEGIRKESIASDWPMNLNMANSVSACNFMGFEFEGSIIIAASFRRRDIDHLIIEFFAIKKI